MPNFINELKTEEAKLRVYHTALKFALDPTASCGVIAYETERKMDHLLAVAFLCHFGYICDLDRERADEIAKGVYSSFCKVVLDK